MSVAEKRLNSTGKNQKTSYQDEIDQISKILGFDSVLGVDRLSSASNYKGEGVIIMDTKSPPQSIKPIGTKASFATASNFKRVTSAYSTNNRQRGVPLTKLNTKESIGTA